MPARRSVRSSRAIERGVDEVQLARAIVRYLRDLAVLQVAPNRAELVDASDEERAELARARRRAIDRTRVTQMFDRMLRCCDELGKTLQPRLVLDCALIDVATIEPLVPLGDLIERLGELEARIARRGRRACRRHGRRRAAAAAARGRPAARARAEATAQPGRACRRASAGAGRGRAHRRRASRAACAAPRGPVRR